MLEFYMVSFETDGNYYFYKDKEKAYAFVLESYCDDYPDASIEEIGAVNEQLADNDGIIDYAWIDSCVFEDD